MTRRNAKPVQQFAGLAAAWNLADREAMHTHARVGYRFGHGTWAP